jgi:hypothetical protein
LRSQRRPPVSPGARPTSLDLDAIVTAGWLEPDQVPRDEFAAAQRFWHQRRRSDATLAASAEAAASVIRAWTGRTAHELGPYAVRLHLPSSDLDLGIGYDPDPNLDEDAGPDPVRAALAAHARYQGEEETRSGGTRSSYTFPWQGVDVDVSVFTEADLAHELRLLAQIRAGLGSTDATVFLWVKQQLHLHGRADQYRQWKHTLYLRFCPQPPPP